jgi:hypothetical protein
MVAKTKQSSILTLADTKRFSNSNMIPRNKRFLRNKNDDISRAASVKSCQGLYCRKFIFVGVCSFLIKSPTVCSKFKTGQVHLINSAS